MNRHHIALIARRELIDIRRSGGILVMMLLVPLLFVAFIAVLPGWLEGRQDDELRGQVFDVAVARPVPDTIEARASSAKVRFKEVDDVRAAVEAKDAHVGLSMEGAPTDERRPARVELAYLASRISSLRALDRVVRLIQAEGDEIVTERLAARSLPAAAARPIDVEERDLSGSPEGSRLALARTMALIVAFPFINWVSMVARRISASKESRTFEPTLLLPVARRDLLLGIGAGNALFSLLTLPALALPILLTTLRPFGRTAAPVDLTWSMVPGAVLGAMLFGLLAVVFGLLTGASSQTSGGLASVMPFVTMAFTLTGIVMQFTSIYAQWWSTLIPVAAPLAFVQQSIAGTVDWWSPITATLTTLAVAVVALRVAVSLIDTDRGVLRASS